MKIYIAGPMTGYPEWNFPAFARVAAALREAGHEVVSPHELHDSAESPSTALPWPEQMKAAIKSMLDCDTIYMLHGWTGSKGACLEWRIAHALDFVIIYQPQEEANVH